jgi:hypothetical protein
MRAEWRTGVELVSAILSAAHDDLARDLAFVLNMPDVRSALVRAADAQHVTGGFSLAEFVAMEALDETGA